MPAPEARPTVLVVDDDLGVLDLLRDLLESRGYHVLTALSGEDAVRAVAGQPVQAVVVDLFLPGMDGLQLITRLAPQLSPAAAIVITGYATILGWTPRGERESGPSFGSRST